MATVKSERKALISSQGILCNFVSALYLSGFHRTQYVVSSFCFSGPWPALFQKKILSSSVFPIGSLKEAIILIIDYLWFNGGPFYSNS